jgi:hypothetical protein
MLKASVDPSGDVNERMKASASKKAARMDDLSGRFFPHFLESGVRNGEIVSSWLEAKNSSNE